MSECHVNINEKNPLSSGEVRRVIRLKLGKHLDLPVRNETGTALREL